MPSPERSSALDSFEDDVPITWEDVVAQERIRRDRARRMTSAEYLEWCSWLTRDHVWSARDLHEEPFELPTDDGGPGGVET